MIFEFWKNKISRHYFECLLKNYFSTKGRLTLIIESSSTIKEQTTILYKKKKKVRIRSKISYSFQINVENERIELSSIRNGYLWKEKFKNCKRHGMVRCYLTEENSNFNDIPFKRNKKGKVRIKVTVIIEFPIKCSHKLILYWYINLKLNYLC